MGLRSSLMVSFAPGLLSGLRRFWGVKASKFRVSESGESCLAQRAWAGYTGASSSGQELACTPLSRPRSQVTHVGFGPA